MRIADSLRRGLDASVAILILSCMGSHMIRHCHCNFSALASGMIIHR